MDIPIIVSGKETGRLSVGREGPYTLFQGCCEDNGEVLRLSVYGGGREGRLGVMAPGEGGLTLRRKLSRAAMAAFPDTIEYAGPSGQAPAQAAAPASGAAPGAAASAEDRPAQETPSAPPREASFSAGEGGSGLPGEPTPEQQTDGAGLLWYSAGDGSLFTTWAGRHYRAIPMAAHGLPESLMVERRIIEGVEYAIFELSEEQVVE